MICCPSKTLDDFEINIAVTNQINNKVAPKEWDRCIKEKIEYRSDKISKFDETEPAKVTTLMSDIRLAISNAKEDISKNESKKIKTFSAPQIMRLILNLFYHLKQKILLNFY